MNAAQQKLNQYDRAKAPRNSSPFIRGDVQNVEFLNEHRSQKLREASEMRRIEEEKKRISELEHYYNLKPVKKAKNEAQVHPKTGRRKLDANYIVTPGAAPAKTTVKKDAGQNTQKRLVFSEITRTQSLLNKNLLLARAKSAGTTIITILTVFVMLSCVLIKQAEISNQTYLNSQMEKEISTLNIELSKLNMERALKEDLTSVQYSAGSKGMSRPSDTQVVFVSVNPMPIDNYQLNMADAEMPDNYNVMGTQNENERNMDNKNNNINGIFNRFADMFKKSGETVKGWLN